MVLQQASKHQTILLQVTSIPLRTNQSTFLSLRRPDLWTCHNSNSMKAQTLSQAQWPLLGEESRLSINWQVRLQLWDLLQAFNHLFMVMDLNYTQTRVVSITNRELLPHSKWGMRTKQISMAIIRQKESINVIAKGKKTSSKSQNQMSEDHRDILIYILIN